MVSRSRNFGVLLKYIFEETDVFKAQNGSFKTVLHLCYVAFALDEEVLERLKQMLQIGIVLAGNCELNTSEPGFSLRYLELVKTRQSLF